MMNTAGQIASLVCPPLVAYSVVWFNNWSFPLYVMGGMFLIGAGCWLVIDPTRPVFQEA
jgi:MFS transporter, ACS family, glucarate transporter